MVNIDLTQQEVDVLIDGLTDTLFRLHHDKRVKEGKVYRNRVVRLKTMLEVVR